MADSRILQLSQRIAVNTENLNSYLTTNQLPQPSFSVDAPLKSTIPQTEAEIVRARQEIINDTLELHQLALGPQDYLMGYSVSLNVCISKSARLEQTAFTKARGSRFKFE